MKTVLSERMRICFEIDAIICFTQKQILPGYLNKHFKQRTSPPSSTMWQSSVYLKKCFLFNNSVTKKPLALRSSLPSCNVLCNKLWRRFLTTQCPLLVKEERTEWMGKARSSKRINIPLKAERTKFIIPLYSQSSIHPSIQYYYEPSMYQAFFSTI